MNVLLIEDDPWFGELLQTLLGRAGYRVDWQRDGYDGFDAIDRRRPDVIVLDVMLPWANGLQFLHELASHTDLNAIPVILCSSVPPPAAPQTLRAYGVATVIDKSAGSPRQFVRTVTEVLQAHHARRV